MTEFKSSGSSSIESTEPGLEAEVVLRRARIGVGGSMRWGQASERGAHCKSCSTGYFRAGAVPVVSTSNEKTI
jgi:hypothetical protein